MPKAGPEEDMARGSREGDGPRRGRVGWARFRLYVLGVAAAAAVVTLLIVVASLGDDGDAGGGPVVVPSPIPAEIEREGHVLGSADAPVTIIEYEDFQ